MTFWERKLSCIIWVVLILTFYFVLGLADWVSLVAQTVKNLLQCKRPRFNSWVRKMPWSREWQPTPVQTGKFWPQPPIPQWLSCKESVCNAGASEDMASIHGSVRSLGGGHGNPLQCCYLENPMDRGVWWATVHRVTKSWIWPKQLSMHA